MATLSPSSTSTPSTGTEMSGRSSTSTMSAKKCGSVGVNSACAAGVRPMAFRLSSRSPYIPGVDGTVQVTALPLTCPSGLPAKTLLKKELLNVKSGVCAVP